MKKTKLIALILAGGRGDRLSILSEERAKPAVLFGGKYRIIDFVLSNCAHSGITKVGLLTQYRPRSLNDHIGIGRPWDLDRTGGGIILLQPYTGREFSGWYQNTADAVYRNLEFVDDNDPREVLILAGDHIYNMQYDEMIAFHRRVNADCTIGTIEVPIEEAARYGIVTLDEEGQVLDFVEKPAHPQSNVASMGIYLFKADILRQRLTRDAEIEQSTHDFGRDIIPDMINDHRVYGYHYRGYWRDVGTVQSYWEANMDLVQDVPKLDLYDDEFPVLTRTKSRPPHKAGPHARITRSLVCDGSIINGEVRDSVISRGVYVEAGAVVEESILFDGCRIESGARIHRAILDRAVHVGQGAHIGWGEDFTPNETDPKNLSTGITLIGKSACIPPGMQIGRNCMIHPATQADAFGSEVIQSGETVSDPSPARLAQSMDS